MVAKKEISMEEQNPHPDPSEPPRTFFAVSRVIRGDTVGNAQRRRDCFCRMMGEVRKEHEKENAKAPLDQQAE
jgi:hypothetical protein